MPGAAPGFTLLEVLVTLALVGLLAGSLQQGMQALLRGYHSQTRALSVAHGTAAAEQVLRGLIAQARAGTFTGQPPDFSGTTDRLSFTTELPDPAGFPRGADVTLLVDPSHRLALRWLAHYPAWTGPARLPAEAVLLEDVATLELGYWQPARSETGGAWVSPWPERFPPRLVRLRISFPHASGRRPLEIVAATRRDRWQP